MKWYRLIVVNVLVLSLNLNASKTVIKGNAKLFTGNEISFSTLKDYISKEKLALGYSNIDKNGNYSFEFETDQIRKINLKIEDKTTWFFAEPGKVYNLNLSYDADLNKGRVYDKQLSLIFNFPLPNELNQLIMKFNANFDQFIDENTLLFKKRDRTVESKLKSFKIKILKEFETYNSAFVNDYITYSIATTFNSLDVGYTAKANKNSNNTRANIYLEFLNQKPILYYNPEYINFFKEFFSGELKTLSLQMDGLDISKSINDKASFDALSKALSKYPFLTNEEFRNLFILNGLQGISSDKYFTKSNIVSILKQLATTSKVKEQREIANNIIEKITKVKFGEGSEAPEFSLLNINGETIELSKFKGKPVYLTFWTNWSIPAKKEMKILESIYKKYKNKVHFISICADNDIKKLENYLKKNPEQKWTFLHYGKDKKILDKYNIVTYPTYVLLDKNLIVYKFPAGRPGGTAERATEDNIERDFYDLTK